jgi:protein SCO1/2
MSCYCIITKNRWGAIFFQFLLMSTIMLWGVTPVSAGVSGKYFPNVPLVNQDGKTLHFYDDVIKGKVVSINFMFTSCPDSCPLETAKLRKVQKLLGDHLGKNVHMYSISVDPDRDTPAVLKAYMKKFDVGPGWQFLTGKQEDVDLIRKKFGVYADDETELSDHQITFVLGNEKSGQWLKRTPFDLPQTIVATLLGRLQTHSLAGLSGYTTTGTPAAAARPGEDLFNTRCTACHTIGQGDKLGPDLLGVVNKRDRAWLERWLHEPDVMLAEKDPVATALYIQYNKVTMPNLRLEHQNVLDLIEYLQEQSQQVAASAGASTGITPVDTMQADNRAKRD